MKFKLFLPIIIALILIGVGIWFMFGKDDVEPVIEPIPDNWLTYTNEEYSYSFQHPEEWDVITCAKTIVIAPDERIEEIQEANCIMDAPKLYVWGLNYKTQEEYENIIEPYRISDSYKDVTKEDVVINGNEAIQYVSAFKRITSHANVGDKFIDTLFPIEGGYVESTFMDQEYVETYRMILNSITF
jgi:hypothetical protein